MFGVLGFIGLMVEGEAGGFEAQGVSCSGFKVLGFRF